MSLNIYGDLARFRVNTYFTMTTNRARSLVYRDIDKVLLRICNSIRKGYALKDRTNAYNEIQRRYPYFEVTVANIHTQRHLEVVISRRHKDHQFSITINEDNISQLEAWCKSWREDLKPKNFLELANFNPNQRYW